MSKPHILIIGGGIGGLALAQGLRKHKISFSIFERDPTPLSRAQGYRIRIAGSGADSLYECLDEEVWDLFEKSCAEMKFGMTGLNAIDGSNSHAPGPPNGPGNRGFHNQFKDEAAKAVGAKTEKRVKGAYTVDRTMLRALLLLNQDDKVNFGKAFTHYELTTSGVKAYFADGTTAEGTLLVGADGLASPVRKQLLPNHRYVDTELRAIYGKTLITPEFLDKFAPQAMNNMSMIKSEAPIHAVAALEAIRFPPDISEVSNNRLPQLKDYMYWVLGTDDIMTPDEEFRRFTGSQAADLSRKLTSDWYSGFKPMFEMQNEEQAAPLRLVSAKPEKPAFEVNKRLTVLGDAAHAMMPTGGSGANCALVDAALLLKQLADTQEKGASVDETVLGTFWDRMWDVALPAILGSGQAGKKLFGFKGWEGLKEVPL